MFKFKKKLGTGRHILCIPTGKKVLLSEIFPKEISGSTLERLDSDGNWEAKETILYQNNMLIADKYTELEPLSTICIELKREITIDWKIYFKSNSGTQQTSVTFKKGFYFEEALYLAQLSSLVYKEKNEIEEVLKSQYHFDTFGYYSKQSHKKLLGKGIAKLLMIFFRGKKHIIDLQFMYLSKFDKKSKKNLVFIIFKGSKEPEDWMTNFSFTDDNFQNRGRVHSGFNQALNLFFRTIKNKNLVSKQSPLTMLCDCNKINDQTTFILAGHSLGGALATLAGCYLLELGIKKDNLELYTFGAPPIGTEDFLNHYKNKLNIYRLVNENDVVPKLDKITKFFHLGEEIMMPSNEGEIHSCEGYIDNIIDSIDANN